MKKLVLLLILGIAVTSVWRSTRTAEPVAADTEPNRLVADRIWIDHVPRNEKDTFQLFAMVSEHAVGVFQAASQWRGKYEGFRYEAHGPELRLLYPQTGDREKVRVKARRCNEGGMDFCLELDGASHGVKRYYSREGWEIGQARDVATLNRQIEDKVEGQIKAQLDALRGQLEAE